MPLEAFSLDEAQAVQGNLLFATQDYKDEHGRTLIPHRVESVPSMRTWLHRLSIVMVVMVVTACAATVYSDWERAKVEDTVAGYERFISHHPHSTYSTEADRKIVQLHFKQAAAENNIAAYERFIDWCNANPGIAPFERRDSVDAARTIMWRLVRELAQKDIDSYRQFVVTYRGIQLGADELREVQFWDGVHFWPPYNVHINVPVVLVDDRDDLHVYYWEGEPKWRQVAEYNVGKHGPPWKWTSPTSGTLRMAESAWPVGAALDEKRKLYVAFHSRLDPYSPYIADTTIIHQTNASGTWENRLVPPITKRPVAIAISPAQGLHVAFQRDGGGLDYGRDIAGTWKFEVITTRHGSIVGMQLDGKGRAHLLYVERVAKRF